MRRAVAGAALALLTVAACGGPDPAAEPGVSPPPTTSGDGAQHPDGHETRGVALPSSHVHGVAVNPADDLVYLATHEGLFRMTESPERVGPVIDLMGFGVVGPDHFVASGHPGPDADLPNPVGLIESRDGGETWTPLSRQGESDFHALAASEAAVIGFDGALRRTTDGTTWTELTPPVAPFALATSPDGQVVVATSESGPIRSTDGGETWDQLAQAPLLMLVAWSDAQDVVAGVAPDGTVAVSSDAGQGWEVRGSAGEAPQALEAVGEDGEDLTVLVVTSTELLESTDGGASFAPFEPTS